MVGASCESLEKETEYFKQWIMSRNEYKNHKDLKCYCDNERDFCALEIDSIIPQFSKNSHKKISVYEGPNCFNASLLEKGLIKSRQYTSEREFAFWMESSGLCHEISPGEEKPGDIGGIYFEPYPEEKFWEHSFIYISPHLAFSKNGKSQWTSYAIQSKDYVLGLYQLSDYHVQYFRCHSLKQYYETNPNLKLLLTEINLPLLSAIKKYKMLPSLHPSWENSFPQSYFTAILESYHQAYIIDELLTQKFEYDAYEYRKNESSQDELNKKAYRLLQAFILQLESFTNIRSTYDCGEDPISGPYFLKTETDSDVDWTPYFWEKMQKEALQHKQDLERLENENKYFYVTQNDLNNLFNQ